MRPCLRTCAPSHAMAHCCARLRTHLEKTPIMVQAMQNPVVNKTAPNLQIFKRCEKEATHPPWLFPLRKAGLARFAELGFPTVRNEAWRFTNVAPIAKLPFKPVFEE